MQGILEFPAIDERKLNMLDTGAPDIRRIDLQNRLTEMPLRGNFSKNLCCLVGFFAAVMSSLMIAAQNTTAATSRGYSGLRN